MATLNSLHRHSDSGTARRHIKPAYQGRLLFFAAERSAGFERLIVLAVYKKQGQKAPQHILETAKRRKKQWEAKRSKA